MLQARMFRDRLCGKIAESQETGDMKYLVPTFNEVFEFYMKILLPEVRKIHETAADHLKKNRQQIIHDYSKTVQNATPSS